MDNYIKNQADNLVSNVSKILKSESSNPLSLSESIIKKFTRVNTEKDSLNVYQYILDNKEDYSLKTELHPDRIAWIASFIREGVLFSKMRCQNFLAFKRG